MKGERRTERDKGTERKGSVGREKEQDRRTEREHYGIIVVSDSTVSILIVHTLIQSLVISLNPSVLLSLNELLSVEGIHKAKANNQSCSIINIQNRIMYCENFQLHLFPS